MTVARAGPGLGVPSLGAAVGALRARGLRVSAARRLVLEALFAAQGPVSAEGIASGLGGRLPLSDLGSVYRNLETLEAAGLVHHVHLGHGAGLYTVAASDEQGYAVCERCGRHAVLEPAVLADVRRAVREACGYDARFGHFPIVGRCADCAAQPPVEHPREHHPHP